MSVLSTRYRTALVTGASSGLGRAFTEMLLAEDVLVWGTARSHARLAALTKRSGFTPVLLDLTDTGKIETVYTTASRDAEGAFDLVINNACYGVFGEFTATAPDVWQAQVTTALTGTLLVSHYALQTMLARKSGCLVNVSSVAVDFPLPFMSGYNVVKAGLSALSESLIFETAGRGVTVIDFRPGDYRTDFNQAMQVTSSALKPAPDLRLARAWQRLEENLAGAPDPRSAASDLRRSLLRGKSGTIYSGSFFQAKLAPLFSRWAPARLRRSVAARYFGVV